MNSHQFQNVKIIQKDLSVFGETLCVYSLIDEWNDKNVAAFYQIISGWKLNKVKFHYVNKEKGCNDGLI